MSFNHHKPSTFAACSGDCGKLWNGVECGEQPGTSFVSTRDLDGIRPSRQMSLESESFEGFKQLQMLTLAHITCQTQPLSLLLRSSINNLPSLGPPTSQQGRRCPVNAGRLENFEPIWLDQMTILGPKTAADCLATQSADCYCLVKLHRTLKEKSKFDFAQQKSVSEALLPWTRNSMVLETNALHSNRHIGCEPAVFWHVHILLLVTSHHITDLH